MQRTPRLVWLRPASAAVLALTALIVPIYELTASVAGRAQQTAQASQTAQVPGALRLTAARAQAFIDARDRRLNYLPGEVLVKFKSGVSIDGEQRALMTLRSRPEAASLEWVGEVALLRDASQPDAAVLAAQLSTQPEVEYAEPNFIAPIPRSDARYQVDPTPPSARPSGTPKDTDFAARQWNFTDLNVPKAWDIQPGGSANLIVAVVDTGISVTKTTMTFRVSTGSTIINTNVPFDVSPDLTSAKFVKPFDFAFFSSGSPVLDMDSHGTHVASTIAETTNNNLALAGWPTRPDHAGEGLHQLWGSGVRARPGSRRCRRPMRAARLQRDRQRDSVCGGQRRRVINISLGGTTTSRTLLDALNYAVQHGAFVGSPGATRMTRAIRSNTRWCAPSIGGVYRWQPLA
jgi:hypothetical protein